MQILQDRYTPLQPTDILRRVLHRLDSPVRTVSGYKAPCPIHNVKNSSLSLKEGEHAIVLKCWAGCPTQDILAAIGLGFRDLFYDHDTTERTTRSSKPRRPEPSPHWYWNWRKLISELAIIGEVRSVLAEDYLDSLQGININSMPDATFDRLMADTALARSWIDLGETIADFCFDFTQIMRTKEMIHGHH